MSAAQPTAAQDVVAVLNADLRQVFQQARAIKATVKRESKAMEHPLETGATVTDHRIILPVGIDLALILSSEDYRGVYQQVRDLFIKGDLLTVQTRVDSFPSMLIDKMPHEETPELFDGVALALSLKEAKFIQAQFSALAVAKVAKKKDASTVQKGQQQPTESPPARKQSVLSGMFK